MSEGMRDRNGSAILSDEHGSFGSKGGLFLLSIIVSTYHSHCCYTLDTLLISDHCYSCQSYKSSSILLMIRLWRVLACSVAVA
jgi:hypothetical protein